MGTDHHPVEETNWATRAVVLAVLNAIVVGLLLFGLRQRGTAIAEAAIEPTPIPPAPTSAPTPSSTPTPTPCPDDPAVAVYRAADHHLYLEGAVNPSDAEVFVAQLSAAIGAENITNNYVLDDCVASGADGIVRIEDGILFDHDSAKIKPQAHPVLDLAAVFVGEFPVTLAIEGHTDDEGTAEYNLDLSTRRAQAAVEYLVASGVAGERLSFEGFGETAPIATNATDHGRSQNRRIEFRLTRTGPASSDRESPGTGGAGSDSADLSVSGGSE